MFRNADEEEVRLPWCPPTRTVAFRSDGGDHGLKALRHVSCKQRREMSICLPNYKQVIVNLIADQFIQDEYVDPDCELG